MVTHNLGYPRIGDDRELKKACESFWAGRLSQDELLQEGKIIRHKNWRIQKQAGLDLIPSNDFSFYDQVLDMTMAAGAIPDRFICLKNYLRNDPMEFYFALARGYQKDGFDITAMEMTKWFDTNYHYIVPEFRSNQKFKLSSTKILDEFIEARETGVLTKPVLIGPVSYLLLGKSADKEQDRLDLLSNLLPVYHEIISGLVSNGVEWIQLDEPFLALDMNEKEKEAYRTAYHQIRNNFPALKILLATYFEGLRDNASFAVELPVNAIHIDLVRAPAGLKNILGVIPQNLMLSLGIVDGRNIWKNDFANSLRFIKTAVDKIGEGRIMIAPSCSLIHSPLDLDLENDTAVLPPQIKEWMAFAKQKTEEVVTLRNLAYHRFSDASDDMNLYNNQLAVMNRKSSTLVHNEEVKERMSRLEEVERIQRNPYPARKDKQQQKLRLPLFPTTTIGSFPQTKEVRSWRSKFKKGELSKEEYESNIRKEIENAIRWQEETGLDVLVHGEFERNDMVEYFGEMLGGFIFTANGWVQSYGSRCVKPPVIFGDVYRKGPMTVEWIKYAQSLTNKPVKGMLTGPVTILQWSFVRDDQPRSETCLQIALAIRDEVLDLEKAGISIIQIDEPALREGLPLRRADRKSYLDWAVRAFRIVTSGVNDETQIHTHMCYSEFNDIIREIASLDADVITIESSRSKMELLDAFGQFRYPNDIGPGIYDIHSPRVPEAAEMAELLKKAVDSLSEDQIWVNPDCGLKTRGWDETKRSLANMVKAAQMMKERHALLIR